MIPETLKTAWKKQRQWSETANKLRSNYEKSRLIMLTLTVVAAITGALSEEFATRILSAVAAISAALSPIIASKMLGSSNLQAWLRARSASEAIKAEIFKYLTSTDTQRLEKLSAAQREILETVKDIPVLVMRDDIPKRAILQDLQPKEYLEGRVTQQISGYYLPKSRQHASTAKKYKTAHLILMFFGSALAASNAIFDEYHFGAWIAVISTVAASILAHLGSGRQEYLAVSYHATADRLQTLKDSWLDRYTEKSPSQEDITKLVENCEEAISVENQEWHTKLISTKEEV